MPREPFGAQGIRARVLAGWAASPARFREDANAEEDLVLGGYRDRLLVELLQNAADAAARGGPTPGRVRVSLIDGVLSVANTGAPLDADGVQALATLRASAKRTGGTVGRFGVGFAAVLAVTDAPEVRSETGAVTFDAERTRSAVAELPALSDELARRSGRVPVLRLPFGTTGRPPAGFATEVRLPLRSGTEVAVRRALTELSADVLLALPALAEIHVAGRSLTRLDRRPDVELTDGGRTVTWRVVDAAGELPPELLADRPVEERERTSWSVRWAVPLADGRLEPLSGRQVVHAPTASDEPLSLPVRLVASYPLDPDRRHVAPGPLTDAVTTYAATAYVELLRTFGDDPRVLALVPRLGLAAAELDATLAGAVLSALRGADWLPAAAGGQVSGGRAVALDAAEEGLVAALREVVPGLLPAVWSTATQRAALDAVGVARWGVGDVVDLLGTVARPPTWWRAVYAGLSEWGLRSDPDALAALPVPLADGRTAFGPRGLLVAEAGLPLGELTALPLRIVAAGAVHPLLERLGARPATAAALLADPEVRAAAEASLDDAEPEAVTAAVLALVAAADARPGEHPWLAELALPDADGGWAAAGELMLPGSPLSEILDTDSLGVVAPRAVERWGIDVLAAAGALSGFAVLVAGDIEVGDELDLDAVDEWYDAVLDRLPDTPTPPRLLAVTAVRDLELVRPPAWPQALRLLAAVPDAVLDPVTVELPDGGTAQVPSYTVWWLAIHPVLAGQRPDRLRAHGSTELTGLYDQAPADTPPFLTGPTTVADVLADADGAAELLYRLGDPQRHPSAALRATAYAAVAATGLDVPAPRTVRALDGRVVPAADAAVLDVPYVLPLVTVPLVGGGPRPGAVADLLDLPLASDLARGPVGEGGTPTAWADQPGAALAAARLGLDRLPGDVVHHDRLTVGGRPVPWWPGAEADHVDRAAGVSALGRALAWRHGAWDRRAALAEALAADEATATRLAAEDAL